ncbi:hypothetical protein TSOC_013952 [Tetrabaena socialis]|uniref:SWIM-type domain-containing protein n=1 Tax=Tetrabaena socialis TaxID=47790 RepID=A0A2J7ZIY8_9CHLO|nr:hypothetical protein TSOC_013952 [Tetrabaena socialis]|eukprot:PNH00235.1 hypothetical protein TSOC_013952 [Tetrabaena socialis]
MAAAVEPRWRQATFIQDVRSRVSASQLTRFQKMYTEPFFVINVDPVVPAPVRMRLTVSGSQQATYVVTLQSTGLFKCSCKDAIMTCRRNGCVCKHVCFVLYRVLRHEGLDFFDNLQLTPDEVGSIASRASQIQIQEVDRSNPPHVAPRPDQLHFDFCHSKRPHQIEAGDDCPICFDALLGSDVMRFCPECGNGVHQTCIVKWMEHRSTCVYCRSKLWSNYRGD